MIEGEMEGRRGGEGIIEIVVNTHTFGKTAGCLIAVPVCWDFRTDSAAAAAAAAGFA